MGVPKVGKDPIIGTPFAMKSPSGLVMKCTWTGFEVQNWSVVVIVDLFSIL
jgi:hypothetical protein